MMNRPRPIAAALAYLALIFSLGFGLGVVRTLWLAPAIGAFAAVACEIPLILSASWLAARRLIRRYAISTPAAAAAMGGLAFVLLLIVEAALARAMTGQSLRAWLAALGTPAGALGLAGQAGFALLPLMMVRRGAR